MANQHFSTNVLNPSISTKIQGQSELATELKQRGLSFAFLVNLTVAARQILQWPESRYINVDLNSGCGWNEKAGCIGSPYAFIREAQKLKFDRYLSFFCDIDAEQCKALVNRLDSDNQKNCFVMHCDNADFIEMLPEIAKEFRQKLEYVFGSVLSDPNGSDIPLEQLEWLSMVMPKLDIILHWNSTVFKRERKGIKPSQITLAHALKKIRKEYWLIRKPVSKHQFTLLIGRNYPFGDYRKQGYHHLHTEMGKWILDRCSYTFEELAEMAADRNYDLF